MIHFKYVMRNIVWYIAALFVFHAINASAQNNVINGADSNSAVSLNSVESITANRLPGGDNGKNWAETSNCNAS